MQKLSPVALAFIPIPPSALASPILPPSMDHFTSAGRLEKICFQCTTAGLGAYFFSRRSSTSLLLKQGDGGRLWLRAYGIVNLLHG